MPERTRHVAIVGAGIAGTSLAYALREEAEVTLFDASGVGRSGASSLPAALLNPNRGRTARAHPDDLAGLAAFWRRDDALRAAGHDTGAVRSGVLRIASSERQAADWRDAAAAGGSLRRLSAAELPPAYHAPHGALLVSQGGWVRPNALLAALAAAARGAGVRIREHAPVRRVTPADGGFVLDTPTGPCTASHVVFCTGAEPLPPELDPGVELQRVEGDVVELRTPLSLALPVAGAVYGAAAGGSAWVGGNHREPGRPDPAAPEALRRSFSWFVPDLRDAPIASVWTGTRVKRRGNRPLVTEIAERVWVFGALAGRGFLCGAAEAERLAARLLARG